MGTVKRQICKTRGTGRGLKEGGNIGEKDEIWGSAFMGERNRRNWDEGVVG